MKEETTIGASSRQELVVFVSAVRPAEYQSLRRHGFPLALLYDPSSPVRAPDPADFVEIADVPFVGDEPLRTLRRWQDQYGIDALLVTVEWGVKHHAALLQALGLPGPSHRAVTLALEKSAMRERFLERIGPDSTAPIAVITDEVDIWRFAAQHGYPFVLKPTNLYGSMYVSLVRDMNEATAAYRWTVPAVRRHLDEAGRKDEPVVVQAESFLRGTCHSIDFIIDAQRGVHATPAVDVMVGRDIGWDDFHHFARVTPSRMLAAEVGSATELAAAGCNALGLSNCVAHVEFILTAAGPRLLEIGARPGGNRVRILQEAFGIDLMFAYYSMQRGRPFDLASTRRRPMGIVTPFPRREGCFRRCRGMERVSALPTYSNHVVNALPGELIGPALRGYRASISIELIGSTTEAIERDARAIASLNDLIETELMDDG